MRVVTKWFTSGLPVVYQWSTSGLPVVYKWSTNGLPVVDGWDWISERTSAMSSAVLINDQWEVRVQKKQMAFNFSQWEELIKLQLQLHYSGKFRIQCSYNSNNLDDLEYNMNTIQIQSAYDSNNL